MLMLNCLKGREGKGREGKGVGERSDAIFGMIHPALARLDSNGCSGMCRAPQQQNASVKARATELRFVSQARSV